MEKREGAGDELEWIRELVGFNEETGRFRIRIEGHFEASHYLYRYFKDGSDEPLHGHSWKVELHVARSDLGIGEDGISYDFLKARRRLDLLTRRLDHTCINELEEFRGINPTTENVAKWFYRGLEREVASGGGRIVTIVVYEGPFHCASFEPAVSGSEPFSPS